MISSYTRLYSVLFCTFLYRWTITVVTYTYAGTVVSLVQLSRWTNLNYGTFGKQFTGTVRTGERYKGTAGGSMGERKTAIPTRTLWCSVYLKAVKDEFIVRIRYMSLLYIRFWHAIYWFDGIHIISCSGGSYGGRHGPWT